jgi:glycolate oxidase FAD binding subunit
LTATSASARSAASTAEVLDQIRDATGRRRAVRIVGGGTWLDANRPVRADATLVLSAVSGIVEYEPGDLTLTARAGTTLDEIARATAAHGQWLTLDPFGDPLRATLGATIATASFGPLAHHFGTPRDVTLGVEFVTGAGNIVRGGGRVVKNVAGFDLTRLITGSWGSLGAVTEATVRLRALPIAQCTLAIDVGDSREALEGMRMALRGLPFVPFAAELLDTAAAGALSIIQRGATLLVRLGGNAQAVSAQRDQLRVVGAAREIHAEVWRRFQALEPARAVVVRLSRRASSFATTWRDAVGIVERWPGGYCHGDPGRGIARVALPLGQAVTDSGLQAVLDIPFDGSRVYERLPAGLWNALAPPAIRERIDRDIKAAFDPHKMLNPGILGEMP